MQKIYHKPCRENSNQTLGSVHAHDFLKSKCNWVAFICFLNTLVEYSILMQNCDLWFNKQTPLQTHSPPPHLEVNYLDQGRLASFRTSFMIITIGLYLIMCGFFPSFLIQIPILPLLK